MKYLLLFSLLIEELIHNFQNIWLGGHVRSEAAALLTQCCAGPLNQASGQPLPALLCFPGVQLGGECREGSTSNHTGQRNHWRPGAEMFPLLLVRFKPAYGITLMYTFILWIRDSHLPLPFLLNWQRVRFCTWFTDVH